MLSQLEREREGKKRLPLLKPFTCEAASQQVEVPQEKHPGTRFQPISILLCTTLTPSLLPPRTAPHFPSLPRGQSVLSGGVVHSSIFFPVREIYSGHLR